jgi:hypothetical protein
MNTGGGVFGENGGAGGFGSVLPSDIQDEGFEDLGGPGGEADAVPFQPVAAAPFPGAQGAPARQARRPATRGPVAPRAMPGYPVMGLGQDGAPLIQVQQCSRVGPALVGALAGGVIVGLSCFAYSYYRGR